MAATAPTRIMQDIAHRRDSSPSDGLSISLKKPTVSGPSPRPIRFIARKKMAEATARIEAGTRLCVTASEGPKYMLCSEAQQPRHEMDKKVFCKKRPPAAKSRERIIA